MKPQRREQSPNDGAKSSVDHRAPPKGSEPPYLREPGEHVVLVRARLIDPPIVKRDRRGPVVPKQLCKAIHLWDRPLPPPIRQAE